MKIKRADRSPLNKSQWLCELECGCEVWVTAVRKPKKTECVSGHEPKKREPISRAHSLVGYRPEDRPEDDFYPTPPPATQALLRVETFKGLIWECACGDGAMSKVLQGAGYETVDTDITPRGFGTQQDFLWFGSLLAPNIVTNPPFRKLNEFIEKATSYAPEKIVFFAKLAALESQERSYIMERTHLTRVWVFRERLSVWRNGIADTNNGGMIAYCWLIWEKGHTGPWTGGWI